MNILDKIRPKEPMISGIDHVAIIVKDMDRSIKFYSEVLGLVILYDGRKDGGNKKSFLGIKEKSFVALTENPDKNMDHNIVESVCHIAFKVAKLERAKESLERKGVKIIEEKTNKKGKVVACHFLDPDGFELEIYGEEMEIVPAY
ncbi:MAG: VOC family protein [Thermodesulfobacteriota bacterium]